MSEYYAKVQWRRGPNETYVDNKYSRGHKWFFDGGVSVPASSSPHIVPLPYSVEANVDPEEAFVASVSSCHMLFFLSIAAKKHFIVEQYIDNAVGEMKKDSSGKLAMTRVTLKPEIIFFGESPTFHTLKAMHHQSHEQCFIANSIKAEVVTEIISSND